MSVELQPVLVDGPAIARRLGIDPSTVRAWASAGLIERRGRKGRRNLYDLDEVIRVSESGARGVRRLRALRSITVQSRATRVPGERQR